MAFSQGSTFASWEHGFEMGEKDSSVHLKQGVSPDGF
jgi:hypothetical protein